MSEDADDFKVWVSRVPTSSNQLGLEGVTLKKGPQVCKTVALGRYGPETGEVKKTELRFRTARRDASGGFDFDNADTWACENVEIEKLQAFLNEHLEPGRYRLLNTQSAEASVVEMLRSGEVDAQDLVRLLGRDGRVDLLATALAQSELGLSAAETAVVARRRGLIADLSALVASPDATETDVQRLISNEWWLFGGRYVGVADRRSLVMLDQFDIPLLGADGTLHIVELKGPNIPKLVYRHRSHLIVGQEVHEAVAQAMNYLRGLDEQGATLETTYRNEFGQEYDMRRVFATVVVGHPTHVRGDVTERQVDQTIRSYNAHLSRLQVVTYKDLVDTAERALAFEANQAASEPLISEEQSSSRDRVLGEEGWVGDEPF
jgi:hypothetical protein